MIRDYKPAYQSVARRKPLKVTKDLLAKIEKHASRGLTMAQIAHCIGIADSTFYKYKAADPRLQEAVERGRAKGIEDVTNAMYENAMDGDTTAQIFFLKNRDPQNWRDRREVLQENVNLTPEQWLEQLADDSIAEGTGATPETQGRVH